MSGYPFALEFVNPADADRFTFGEEWHSHDHGATWHQGPCTAPPEPTRATLTVTEIDHETGTVTMNLTPAP